MIRRPPRSTLSSSSAASDVYKRQVQLLHGGDDDVSLNGSRVVIPPLRRTQRRSIAFSTNSYALHDGFECLNESRGGGPTQIAPTAYTTNNNTPLCIELAAPSTHQDLTRFDSMRENTLMSDAVSVSPNSSSNGLGPIFGDLGITDFTPPSPSQSLSPARAVLFRKSGKVSSNVPVPDLTRGEGGDDMSLASEDILNTT
eukprot:TRINITY_DN4420_c0_g1_i2.p1 TRINITY_DN4420_c0_g1~~TRINITY_DN4420_c0_g1_i2.p1  ORF type:complete len:199 (-),score=22.57 TRINITY_DN4420_c0_g1_i2:345-941(-)